MILNQYITKRIIHNTISITAVVCLTISMVESLRLLELLINKSISILQFFNMVLLLVPQYIAIILPFALFAATINTYSNLSKSREILVMRAGGISNFKLLMPSIQVGVLSSIISLALYTTVIPIGFHQFKTMQFKATNSFVSNIIPQSKFINIDANTTIFARSVSGLSITDIILYKKDDKNVQILTAKEGGVLSSNGQTKIVLYNGVKQSGRSKNATILSFDEYIITVDLNIPKYVGKSDIDEYTSIELLKRINDGTITKKETVVYYSRIINSITPLFLAILAGLSVLLGSYNRRQKLSNTVSYTATGVVMMGSIISLTNNATSNLAYLNYAIYLLGTAIIIAVVIVLYSDKRKIR